MCRPVKRTGPPVAIFHPVLGSFIDHFGNESLTISSSVADNALKVITAAQDIYQSEADRVKAMNEPFRDIFGPLDAIQNSGKSGVDTILTSEAIKLNEKAALAILEYKNEIGTGSADPTVQGSFVYAQYWSQNEV